MTITATFSITGSLDEVAKYIAGQAAPGGTPTPTPPPVDFPTDPTVAPFPSPENSLSTWNPTTKTIGGAPYLRDSTGAIWQIQASNGQLFLNFVALTNASQLLLRSGKVYWFDAGFWRLLTGSGGSQTVTPPDPLLPGQTPPPPPPPPSDPPHASPAPGSGTTVAVVGSLVPAVAAAQAGQTLTMVAGQVYNESVLVPVPLVIDGNGAILDAAGVTLVRGKAGIVPVADCTIKNLEIRGFGLNETNAGLTSGIREDVPGWYEVDGCHIHNCQDGIGSGQPSVWTVSNSVFTDNGIGNGLTHNMYFASTLRVILTNVTSTVAASAADPNSGTGMSGGGHALKSRAKVTTVTGGHFSAFDGSCFDFPDGSAQQIVIDGTTITKPPGANDHKIIGYCLESQNNGTAGVLFKNCHFDLQCDNPLFVCNAGAITLDPSCTFSGTQAISQGAGKVTGIQAPGINPVPTPTPTPTPSTGFDIGPAQGA